MKGEFEGHPREHTPIFPIHLLSISPLSTYLNLPVCCTRAPSKTKRLLAAAKSQLRRRESGRAGKRTLPRLHAVVMLQGRKE
jgi:hypothetical protein